MINGLDLYNAYGFPDDKPGTPVNELSDFQKKWLGMITVPPLVHLSIPQIPAKIYGHVAIFPFLIKGLENVVERNLQNEIKTWDGCYNLRPIRGMEKTYTKLNKDGDTLGALRYLSIHSWGCAFDINAAWNGLGQLPTMSLALVKCFEDAGFDWGGNFKRKDGMHFQIKSVPIFSNLAV